MNCKSVLAFALATVASGAVVADDITIDTQRFVSTATRAQVRAELDAFRASGVNPWSTRFNPLAHFRGGRTRAEVTGEFLADRARVAAFADEDSGSSYIASLHISQPFEAAAGHPVIVR